MTDPAPTQRTLWVCLVAWLVLTLSACTTSKPAIPPVPLERVKSPLSIEHVWQRKVGLGHEGKFLQLRPALTEQHLFAAAYDGTVLKVDRLTGQKIWQQALDHTISAGVDAGYGMVVLGTANGRVVCLDQDSGDVVWDVALAGQMLAAPVLSAELVFAQSMDGRLYALERQSGQTRWVFDTTIHTLTLRGNVSPWVAGRVVLAGFANGKLVALDAANGLVGWEHAVSEPTGRSELARLNDITGRFWVSRNRVYAANYQGNLVALDIPTGRLIWNRPLSSFAGLSEQDGALFVTDDASHIWSIDAVNGSENWRVEHFQGRQATAPLSYADFVVVGDYEGYLHWLARDDGRVLARVRPDRTGVWAQPQEKDGIVYVQGNRGNLVAYRVKSK